MITESATTDETILDCIERGLDHFGTSFKYVVYHEIKESQKLDATMLGQKPLSFSEGLDKMFGAGSLSIKNAIVDELSRRFGLSKNQQDLVSMINEIRSDAKVREILLR